MAASRPHRRILHITESPSAGVGRHVLDLTEGLIARGDAVSLIYSTRRIDEAFRERASSMSRLQTYCIDMRRAPHPSDAVALARIRRYVREHGPFDIIHGHSSKGGALARLASLRGSSPVIYTPHCIYTMNPQAGRWAYRLTRAVERTLAQRTSAIIAVSPQEREHVISLGISPRRVHCIVNGVAEPRWSSREETRQSLGLASEEVVIGYLGRLSPQKNPLLPVQALARLKDLPHVRLAIAGTGELETQSRLLAGQLGIADRVRWLGYRTAEDVLPAADIFVLPSSYEAMPYVLLEALSAGLPIVATPVGGVNLVVQDGENGFVVPQGSPDAMAAAIRQLAVSEQLRNNFRTESLNRAGRFTLERMVDETAAVYAQAVHQRSVPARAARPYSSEARSQEPIVGS